MGDFANEDSAELGDDSLQSKRKAFKGARESVHFSVPTKPVAPAGELRNRKVFTSEEISEKTDGNKTFGHSGNGWTEDQKTIFPRGYMQYIFYAGLNRPSKDFIEETRPLEKIYSKTMFI